MSFEMSQLHTFRRGITLGEFPLGTPKINKLLLNLMCSLILIGHLYLSSIWSGPIKNEHEKHMSYNLDTILGSIESDYAIIE